ncbi:hypothetical protein MJ904_18785 [Massilia sp. MB5]|uniref:hypothetical protein n=1 Tax=Massilia sp. MB5 TaxID=2919578 RepID=UPI001F0D2991|nr:hypothetical protein [Massilia sp. MB5]UMR29129.1 hypothetical protein MJ904_18785 [Massilia sp. MB5]
MDLQKGQIIEFDGLPAVVVGLSGDPGVPDDHVALWFGCPDAIRKSRGGPGGIIPEVWTVPIDLCDPGMGPVFKH